MLTAKQQTLLMQAVDKLHEADALVQKALGDTDSCYDTHCGIEELIEDLLADIEDLEVRDE